MWKIFENIVDEYPQSGYKYMPKSKDFSYSVFEEREKVSFRILDDDGEVYFIGQMDKEQYNDCDTENTGPFVPLDLVRYSYGCTEIQFKIFGKWETL